jgi:hypothetical protein
MVRTVRLISSHVVPRFVYIDLVLKVTEEARCQTQENGFASVGGVEKVDEQLRSYPSGSPVNFPTGGPSIVLKPYPMKSVHMTI